MTLLDCGISKEVIATGNHNTSTADELADSKASEAAMGAAHKCLIRQEVGISVDDMTASRCSKNEMTTPIPFTLELDMHPPGARAPDEEVSPFRKRQKIEEQEDKSLIMQVAKESSILDWLRNYDDGVSEMENPQFSFIRRIFFKENTDVDNLQVPLSDILKHFNGSREECVVDLLGNLEGEFMIFKKNNMYRLM